LKLQALHQKYLNEELGHWDENVWYSNSSYKYKAYSTAESKWWTAYQDDYSYNDVYSNIKDSEINRVSNEKEKVAYKSSVSNSLQCAYCGDMVFSLTHYDVSDLYRSDEPSYMWMCDDCVELEESYKKEEKEYYDKDKDKNSSVAIMEVGRA